MAVRYIVYLVPEGELYALLEQYYEESRSVCVNLAHDYLPHCTLTSFFTLPTDDQVLLQRLTSTLQRVLVEACEEHQQRAEGGPLAWVEGVYAGTHIGLAVQAPRIVEAIKRLAREMKCEGDYASTSVLVEPKVRLHISMAYGSGVSRDRTPRLYDRAQQVEVQRQALIEHVQWKVVLLRQAPEHNGADPKLWMLSPLFAHPLYNKV